MIHPRLLLTGAASTWGAVSGVMLAQGLPQPTPNQLAVVLGGVIMLGVGIITVLLYRDKIEHWVRTTAKDEAVKATKTAIEEHSKEAAGRTRIAVQESIAAAGAVQAQALKDHIQEERIEFLAVKNQYKEIDRVLLGQNTRIEYIVELLEHIRGGSSPSVKKLMTQPGLPKIESSPGVKK